jgi:hypothetical protein
MLPEDDLIYIIEQEVLADFASLFPEKPRVVKSAARRIAVRVARKLLRFSDPEAVRTRGLTAAQWAGWNGQCDQFRAERFRDMPPVALWFEYDLAVKMDKQVHIWKFSMKSCGESSPS